jgi:hypothetical protein
MGGVEHSTMPMGDEQRILIKDVGRSALFFRISIVF